MLEGVEAEVALLNSGTLRSDRVHPRGEFRMRDLLAILPMVDPVVVINITGRVGRWGGGHLEYMDLQYRWKDTI